MDTDRPQNHYWSWFGWIQNLIPRLRGVYEDIKKTEDTIWREMGQRLQVKVEFLSMALPQSLPSFGTHVHKSQRS